MLTTGLNWTTWMALGAGVVVTFFVLGSPALYRRWRYRLAEASQEEDLPWDELLDMLEKHNRERATAGLPPEEPTAQEVEQMLVWLPTVAAPRPVEQPEDREFANTAGEDRRAGRRRWGNPIEVHIRMPVTADASPTLIDNLLQDLPTFGAQPLHGLVVNRSTGGLGIFTDQEIPAGTFVTIRAVAAPASVPSVIAEVRHCQRAGKACVLGCQFNNEIPWSVRVWFG